MNARVKELIEKCTRSETFDKEEVGKPQEVVVDSGRPQEIKRLERV